MGGCDSWNTKQLLFKTEEFDSWELVCGKICLGQNGPKFAKKNQWKSSKDCHNEHKFAKLSKNLHKLDHNLQMNAKIEPQLGKARALALGQGPGLGHGLAQRGDFF